MNPVTKAPTVPTAENTLAAFPSQSAKVGSPVTGEVVLDPPAHRPVHRQPRDGVRRHPVDLSRLVAGRRHTADGPGGEHDGELLSGLAVAGVQDDVARVGVDA